MSFTSKIKIMKLLSRTTKRLTFLSKNKLMFSLYFDLVNELVKSEKGLQVGNTPLQIHQFLSVGEGALIDALFIYWETGDDYLGWLNDGDEKNE